MNLWAKRTGQLLLIAVLFLMSCEDDTYFLGFKNEVSKFSVRYVEFSIGDGTVLSIDSVLSDNFSGTQRLLLGQHIDPVLGTVRAEFYSEFVPATTAKIASIPTYTYTYDSMVIEARLDYYSYGLTNESTEQIKIYRIVGDTLSYRKDIPFKINGKDTLISQLGGNRYFTNSKVAYDLGPIGESTYKVRYSKLQEGSDTILIRSRLNDSFGNELFNIALNDVGEQFSNRKLFKSVFKGLVFVPSNCNAIIGINPVNTSTRMRMYYHTSDNTGIKDTLFRDFYTGVSFTNISTSRSAEFPSELTPYSGTSPVSGIRAIQAGSAMVTKIDLNPFYEQFADTLTRPILINEAEIVISSVPSSNAYTPINYLDMRIMKENDKYVDFRIKADSAIISRYHTVTDSRHFYVASDLLSGTGTPAAGLSYRKSKNSYSGNVTLFVQTLIKNKDKPIDNRIRYLGLYPASSIIGINSVTSLGKSVDRMIFNKADIKLRVYYTIPNTTNL